MTTVIVFTIGQGSAQRIEIIVFRISISKAIGGQQKKCIRSIESAYRLSRMRSSFQFVRLRYSRAFFLKNKCDGFGLLSRYSKVYKEVIQTLSAVNTKKAYSVFLNGYLIATHLLSVDHQLKFVVMHIDPPMRRIDTLYLGLSVDLQP